MDGKSADKLREAGKAMGDAQNSLGQKDLDNAGSAQNQALEAMRQGAAGAGASSQQGQSGQQAAGQDPLGRGQVGAGPVGREDSRRHRPGQGARRSWKNCAAAPRR